MPSQSNDASLLKPLRASESIKPIRIRTLLLEGGERFPVLIGLDGLPMFRPTVWTSTMRRASNVATATIVSDLVSLKVLYTWAAAERVSIESRILAGDYLSPSELTSLARCARRPLGNVASPSLSDEIKRPVISLERARHRVAVPAVSLDLSVDTTASRLRVIAAYLGWLAQEGLTRAPPSSVDEMAAAQRVMLDGLKARIPKARGRNVVGRREGPPDATIVRLLSVIEVGSDENPWNDIALRVRNRLLVHMLFGLGIRRGEALGIKVPNIDFRANKLLIARAADDPDDPRLYQALTKTRDRILPLGDGLASMLHQYITQIRSKFERARLHPFLFVSHDDGRPLALVSANKVFRNLRTRVPGLPDNLSPHTLRHAWNDAFSSLMDRARNSPVDPDHRLTSEENLRSYLMGWSPTSGTASTYTRRHDREKAETMSLAHQARLSGIGSDE